MRRSAMSGATVSSVPAVDAWTRCKVSIVVPFLGLSNFILRILKGNPPKGTTMETIGRVQCWVQKMGFNTIPSALSHKAINPA